jgi:hypothetical protein
MSRFKKIFGLVALLLALNCPTTKAMMNIDTEGAGKAAAELLLPIIKPIAEKLVSKISDELVHAIEGMSRETLCKIQCSTGSKATICGGPKRVSFCLHRCSRKIDVGSGFYLLIRYTEKTDPKGRQKLWDLTRCVNIALEKDKEPKEKKEKRIIFKDGKLPQGTIAIYGKQNFDTAIGLISQIIELDNFVLTNGKAAKNKGIEAAKIPDLIAEAKREAILLRKNLAEYIDQGRFGPQYDVL